MEKREAERTLFVLESVYSRIFFWLPEEYRRSNEVRSDGKDSGMTKILITVGGILYLLGGLFHVWLGLGIHNAAGLDPSYRALMEMLNVGAALMSFFFAYASLFHRNEIIGTRLGYSVVWMMMIVFLSRAVGEIVFFNFGIFWFGVSILIAAMYAVVLLSIRASAHPRR
jgi:hypothetical protein